MSSEQESFDLDKYLELTKNVINNFTKGELDSITIFGIVSIAMGVVEKIKDEKHLTGPQKKKLCMEILNIIIDALVNLNKITPEKGAEFKKAIAENRELIIQFIDMASFLTKNPYIINAGKFIIDETKNACSRCCVRCNIL